MVGPLVYINSRIIPDHNTIAEALHPSAVTPAMLRSQSQAKQIDFDKTEAAPPRMTL